MKNIHKIGKELFITSNEEIKEGDWVTNGLGIMKANLDGQPTMDDYHPWKKIILTTDQELIKNSVQAIDDEFLEWFVKNPSCEEIYVNAIESFDFGMDKYVYDYKIIIPKEDWLLNNSHCKQIEHCSKSLSKKCICPKEELKQETLEEVRKVERTELFNSIHSVVKKIPRKEVEGDAMDAPSCAYELEQLFYKWQQERSEKDLKESFIEGYKQRAEKSDLIFDNASRMYAIHLFEQFKNK